MKSRKGLLPLLLDKNRHLRTFYVFLSYFWGKKGKKQGRKKIFFNRRKVFRSRKTLFFNRRKLFRGCKTEVCSRRKAFCSRQTLFFGRQKLFFNRKREIFNRKKLFSGRIFLILSVFRGVFGDKMGFRDTLYYMGGFWVAQSWKVFHPFRSTLN